MGYKYIDEEVFEYALRTIMRDMIEADESFQRRLDEFMLSTNLIKLRGIIPTMYKLNQIENAEVGDLYLVGSKSGSYEEYIFTTEGKWEYLGIMKPDIDLSVFYTSDEVDSIISNKVNEINSSIENKFNGVDDLLSTKLDENDTYVIRCTL